MGFAPVTPFHASGASGAKVSSPCTMHGYSKEDMHSLAHVIRLPHAVHKLGKCLVINAAALQAQVPSTVAITARIYNETSEPLLLMTGLPPRLLTGISPGTTFLRLQKKATGAKTFRDNPDFKNLSWYSPSLYPKAFALMFMSPKMKDVYSSQVEFQYQDEDIEDPLGRFFKGHKNVSKKFKKILANTNLFCKKNRKDIFWICICPGFKCLPWTAYVILAWSTESKEISTLHYGLEDWLGACAGRGGDRALSTACLAFVWDWWIHVPRRSELFRFSMFITSSRSRANKLVSTDCQTILKQLIVLPASC